MSSDESSELSSVHSDDERLQAPKKKGIQKYFPKTTTTKMPAPAVKEPPARKRTPSPEHEYVLADNPDIAFIVMFRSRFNDAFPGKFPNFGPQEIERGVVDTIPGEIVESLLCALLGLLLNRKQDVKSGHYQRALEDAISSHKTQWPKDWNNFNPLRDGQTFASMNPAQRLTLLKTLIIWSLSSSTAIRDIINRSYKQSRHADDKNQPLSVQPWGFDSDKCTYYLIEGLDDTSFRVYRESNPAKLNRTWQSVAGTIEELRALAEKLLNKDAGQKARVLAGKILLAVPRFEATEVKRQRREYRLARKQQFKRPAEGFSSYEGRTRGKRIKYTFSDDDDDYESETSTRTSARNTRGRNTPAEPAGPTVTMSGRQVKPRQGGAYGETTLSGSRTAASSHSGGADEDEYEDEEQPTTGRPTRAAAATGRGRGRPRKAASHIEGYNSVDSMDDEEDASEQDYGDDDEDDVPVASDGDEEASDDSAMDTDEDDDDSRKSLIVKLPTRVPTPEHEKKNITIKLNLTPRGAKPVAPVQRDMGKVQRNILDMLPNGAAKDAKTNGETAQNDGNASPARAGSPLAFHGSPDKAPVFQRSMNAVGAGS